MRSALLGGLSARESYVIFRRLVAGSAASDEGSGVAVEIGAGWCSDADVEATAGVSCE